MWQSLASFFCFVLVLIGCAAWGSPSGMTHQEVSRLVQEAILQYHAEVEKAFKDRDSMIMAVAQRAIEVEKSCVKKGAKK